MQLPWVKTGRLADILDASFRAALAAGANPENFNSDGQVAAIASGATRAAALESVLNEDVD